MTGTIEVQPDFLAIGSDDDFIRMPMTPQTAQKIADLSGGLLNTRVGNIVAKVIESDVQKSVSNLAALR